MPRARTMRMERFRVISERPVAITTALGIPYATCTVGWIEQVQFSGLPSFGEFQAMYDQYRPMRLKVRYTLMSIELTADATPLADNRYSVTLACIKDSDDTNSIGMLAMQEHRYQSKTFSKLGQSHTYTIPRMVNTPVAGVGDLTSTLSAIHKVPWLDMVAPDVRMGCLKFNAYTSTVQTGRTFRFMREYVCDYGFRVKR